MYKQTYIYETLVSHRGIENIAYSCVRGIEKKIVKHMAQGSTCNCCLTFRGKDQISFGFLKPFPVLSYLFIFP